MNFTLGNRVIFESITGRVVLQTGEVLESTVPVKHEDIHELDYIDLEVNAFNMSTHYIERIDVETRQPVLKKYAWVVDEPTVDEKISKLEEDLELLKADKEFGGIL